MIVLIYKMIQIFSWLVRCWKRILSSVKVMCEQVSGDGCNPAHQLGHMCRDWEGCQGPAHQLGPMGRDWEGCQGTTRQLGPMCRDWEGCQGPHQRVATRQVRRSVPCLHGSWLLSWVTKWKYNCYPGIENKLFFKWKQFRHMKYISAYIFPNMNFRIILFEIS